MFPSEDVHTGIRDSGISLLPLPEREEKNENWESDVSSAEGKSNLRTVCARDEGMGFHIRDKFWSLKWFVLGVYESIKSFEDHHDTSRDEGEP